MRYTFVREEAKTHSVELLCETMDVSCSGYYAWRDRPLSPRAQEHQRLIPKIKTIFNESRETYGYRRVTHELKKQQEPCGKHQVAQLMRLHGLAPPAKRRFTVTTDSNHSNPIHPNALNRQFNPSTANTSWVSDITYVATSEGWLFLAVVMDLFSRTIVGWAMDKHMTEELVLNALRMALFRRKVSSKLLLHSDRGSQYASISYQHLLKNQGITCSMSRKGNCWDNAPMESFFRTLKVECVYRYTFETREQAKRSIFDYIEVFYNRQRGHSALNYLSPMNYELALANS
jgi:transposase InsO family protein